MVQRSYVVLPTASGAVVSLGSDEGSLVLLSNISTIANEMDKLGVGKYGFDIVYMERVLWRLIAQRRLSSRSE